LPRALAGGVERGDQIVAALARAARAVRLPVPPARAPPIAQPEDAGACIGRMAHLVGEGVFPALVQHGALDRLLIAHGALVEAARHPGVGHDPALAHRRWLAIQLSIVRALTPKKSASS